MLISQRPTLTEEPVADNRSRFIIEPLEPGFGYTLGNSLRRTLLSSIPGASVTSIRVDGVLHEFTTVPGVKEDITELILNLKELVVSSEDDEPVTMYLRKQGPGDVTAGDIAPPAGVEVHNPDLHIATLNGKGKLEMELTVERGRGYVSAVQNKQVGVVHLDTGRRRDVGGGHGTGALLAQVHDHRLVHLGAHDEPLDVEDDLGDVLLVARHGGELVQGALDADAGDSSAGDRGQQGAAQGVAEGVAEARLEGLDDEPRAVVVDDLFGEGGALCDQHVSCPSMQASAI